MCVCGVCGCVGRCGVCEHRYSIYGVSVVRMCVVRVGVCGAYVVCLCVCVCVHVCFLLLLLCCRPNSSPAGMLSATASLGLILLWDVDAGLTEIDKFLYANDDNIKV